MPKNYTMVVYKRFPLDSPKHLVHISHKLANTEPETLRHYSGRFGFVADDDESALKNAAGRIPLRHVALVFEDTQAERFVGYAPRES